jgi:large subunit ribosomal protein L15
MKLHQLKPTPGSTHPKKRLGRGDSSGHGSQSTKGHKGHKSRSGYHLAGNFEGGQMPVVRRIPKRGFVHVRKNPYQVVNLVSLNKKFNAGDIITPEKLVEAGLIKPAYGKVKVLAKGTLDKPLEIHSHSFSSKAKAVIEKSGGKAVILT